MPNIYSHCIEPLKESETPAGREVVQDGGEESEDDDDFVAKDDTLDSEPFFEEEENFGCWEIQKETIHPVDETEIADLAEDVANMTTAADSKFVIPSFRPYNICGKTKRSKQG